MSDSIRLPIDEAALALIVTAHEAMQLTQVRLLGLLEMALAQHGVVGRVVGWEAKPERVLIVQPAENGKSE